MSKAEIIYSELTESAQVARRMSDGFQDYADELNRKIVNKLNGYSGNHTSRIEGAINSTNSKIHGKSVIVHNYYDEKSIELNHDWIESLKKVELVPTINSKW